MPYHNRFLLDGNIGKPKTLPFYEESNRLNFYIRSRRKPHEVMEFYDQINTLRPVMHAGNLWTTIKKIFKKGKNFTKNAIDYIDQSPLLNTIKDIGFDVIKEKTGIDPNVYYDTARNVINVDKNNVNKTLNKMMDTTKNTIHNYLTDKTENKKFDYKTLLNNYYKDISQTVPQYQPQVKQNFDLFSSGVELSGSNNEVILRNIPKLLMMSKSSRGTYTIKKEFKPLLFKYGIKTLTVPKTLKDFTEQVINHSKGRLNLGHGPDSNTIQTTSNNTTGGNIIKPAKQNTTSGKNINKYNRYNEILEKLKK